MTLFGCSKTMSQKKEVGQVLVHCGATGDWDWEFDETCATICLPAVDEWRSDSGKDIPRPGGKGD